MFAVVGCPSCRHIWIRTGDAETVGCPRCQTRYEVDALRTLAETETAEAAREARTAILAERADVDDIAGYIELQEAVDGAGMNEETYLAAHGIDPAIVAEAVDRRSPGPEPDRAAIVRAAVRDLDDPTREAIIDQAEDAGVPAATVRTILDRLVSRGHAVRRDGRYRLL